VPQNETVSLKGPVDDAARQEVQKLAALVSASSEFMGVATPTGQILYVNEAGRRLCGITPYADVTPMTVLDLVYESDIEKAIGEVIPGIAATGKWEGELRLRHVVTGAPIATYHYAYALYNPTTGERWATAAVSIDQRARKRSEARFRAIFESAAVGIAMIDTENRIETLNATFAELIGRPRMELIGTDYRSLVAGTGDLAKAQRQRAELFAGERGSYSCELALLRADGESLPVRAWVALVEDGEGRPTHTAAAIASLAEQRRLEAHVRQQHKMEALGRMAGGIAHDFNNQLTVIGLEVGELAAVARTGAGDSLKAIEESVGRLRDLTGQLLAFARQERPEVAALDANDVVRGIEPVLRRITSGLADLVLYRDWRPLPVCANVSQLEQVLVNLVANARDAHADHIRLATCLNEPAPDASPSGRTVSLIVADNGEGIPPEHVTKIFDPFFTTKEPGEGTGLGLMTCYSSVSAIGGTIAVESELGEGTTFTVTLPLVDRRA
jgi:two-component system, cell cycle sensor histidine kinase and response regulator CckA